MVNYLYYKILQRKIIMREAFLILLMIITIAISLYAINRCALLTRENQRMYEEIKSRVTRVERRVDNELLQLNELAQQIAVREKLEGLKKKHRRQP